MFFSLEKILSQEPVYRLKQAKNAIFKDLIDNWQKASNLPLTLRERLNKEFPLEIKLEKFSSKDRKVIKAKIILNDGLKIESVLMRHKEGRNTVCVSSQVGCSLGCQFCATGKMGFKRNLAPKEIVNQVLFFSRLLKKENARVTNLVFMGMGEPFLNYKNVLGAIRILNDKDGLNLGARHISISTSGLVEGIKKLSSENLQVNLAISLHAPEDKLRSELMPINKKYPLKVVLRAVDEYIEKTKRQVMFEYLLIKDINDREELACELANLMKHELYFLNLILYNPTGIFVPSLFTQVKKFKKILKKQGIKFSERYRFGQEIKAGCGQLVLKGDYQLGYLTTPQKYNLLLSK